MKLKKCACIETLYTELPFLARFEAAKKDGFEFVEFWSWIDKDLATVKERASAAGIKISGFNGDADYSLIDPSHKKKYLDFLKRSVGAAQKIGALSVTIHSNALGEGGKVIDTCAHLSDTVKKCAMFDALRECAEIAEQSGISMNLEALNVIADHVGNFLVHASDAAEMTRLTGSPKLKILYDIYHMQLNEGNLCGNISAFIDQIGHIHVADVPGRHEPGTGEINYAHVFNHLEKAGYIGLIGYELFPKTTTADAVKAIMNY
ncbi:MAG: TIM barrel protein [Dysgonamonadaceae bacterium]|jgi:hydroxypyruvate isomerase|nr:TIM barrel protein [Dysgonamonadaceae bacterium]